jgi:hypothetical protein
LAIVFAKVELPDIKTEDEYHIDRSESDPAVASGETVMAAGRGLSTFLIWLNIVVLSAALA